MELFAGILMAAIHVVSGPDHLAAVFPFSIESKSKAWATGLSWGIGHTLGALLIGVLYMLFRDYIPIEDISAYSEIIVGALLIAIGIWAFYRIRRDGFSKHIHKNKPIRSGIMAACGIGMFHGFAGISHLMAILPTLVMPGSMQAIY